MKKKKKRVKKNEWLGSCMNGQSPLEEKVPWEQFFISIFILRYFICLKKKKREEVWGEMTRRYWNINLEEMMEAGVHFGHGTRKWNPRMAPYISAKRKGIHIINLTRTVQFLLKAYDFVSDVARENNF